MIDLPVAFPKGHEFRNPDNLDEGYRLTRAVYKTQAIEASQFEPFGGAPKPAPNAPMPAWLPKLLSGHIERYV